MPRMLTTGFTVTGGGVETLKAVGAGAAPELGVSKAWGVATRVTSGVGAAAVGVPAAVGIASGWTIS